MNVIFLTPILFGYREDRSPELNNLYEIIKGDLLQLSRILRTVLKK